MIRCAKCDDPFPKRQGKNVYCVACAASRRLQTRRESAARCKGRHNYVPVGGLIKCQNCGTELTFRGGKHRYCENCKILARKQAFRKFRKSDKGIALYRRLDKERSATPERIEFTASYIGPYLRKRRSEPKHGLNHRMSTMVGRGLRRGKGGRAWSQLLGFDIAELMLHLEKQFLPGMTWENIGSWHIDHIVPLSSFSFESSEDAAFRSAWALTNLRPLWAEDNIRKSNQRVLLL